jgi:hypothetical protein
MDLDQLLHLEPLTYSDSFVEGESVASFDGGEAVGKGGAGEKVAALLLRAPDGPIAGGESDRNESVNVWIWIN